MIYFTSDEHYFHTNIIKYCQRPFSSIEEMNEKLIENHNSVVQNDDIVYHLGDFSLQSKYVKDILNQLNGKHYLITGNHDACFPTFKYKHQKKTFQEYLDYGFLRVEESLIETFEGLGKVKLIHHQYFDKSCDWTLHGHVHEKWKFSGGLVNVGVDVWDYTPVSLPDLVEALTHQ